MDWHEARSNPKIYHWSYIGRRDIKRALRQFIEHDIARRTGYTIVDLGCGDAPYKIMFHGYDRYIGVDVFEHPAVNLVADMWNVPLADASVDFLIATEVMEHSEKYAETVREVLRLLKPGGKAFFSIPFLYPVHGTDDRWRFTINGLEQVFSAAGEREIRPSNRTVTTWAQLFNAFVAGFPLGRYLYPLFFLTNILAIGLNVLLVAVVALMRPLFSAKAYAAMRQTLLESAPHHYFAVISK